jgi:hypothetical protein
MLDIERICMIDVEDVILYSLLQRFTNSTELSQERLRKEIYVIYVKVNEALPLIGYNTSP